MRQNFFIRISFLLLLAVLSLSFPQIALSSADVFVLKGRNVEPYNVAVAGLVEGLGFTPEIYELNGDARVARRVAQKLSLRSSGLVISVGTMASVAASEEIKGIPVVYLLVSRPEVYLKSGGNITGISLNPDPKDQFELLQRFYPSATRVGVIYNPKNSGKEVERIKISAPPGYEIVTRVISSSSDVPAALKQIRKKTDILWLAMDRDIISKQTFQYIVKFSVASNYPLLGFSKSTVRQGALIAAISDYKNIGKEGAKLAKEILAGNRSAFATPHRYPKATGYAYNSRVGKLINRSLALNL